VAHPAPEEARMKLYGVRGSPFVRKALVALEEKGLPYQLETMVSVTPKPPELLALHPLGKIPVLRDGAVVVPDSSVICAYLEKKFPSPALYPDDPAALAKALFLEEYADTRMFEVLGPILFERVVKRFVMKQEPDEARVAEKLERELPPVLDYIESQLPGDRETVLPRFGIADVALGAQLGSLTLSGIEVDAKRWPRTAHYDAALLARPSFKTAMAG
jgi:glutathione S-transferase